MDDDHDAFRTLYERTRRQVLAYCVRRCGSYEDAVDAAAETYVIAWRRRVVVPEGDAALLWLFGTARRVLANQRRGDDRRRRFTERLRPAVPPPDSDPQDALVHREDAGRVAAALRTLSDADQEVLRLIAWEGLTPKEAATVLGCSRPTFDVRLHRARRRLAAACDRAPTRLGRGLGRA